MNRSIWQVAILSLAMVAAGCGGGKKPAGSSGSTSAGTTAGAGGTSGTTGEASTGSTGSTGGSSGSTGASSGSSGSSATSSGSSSGSSGSSGTTGVHAVALSVAPASSTLALGTTLQLSATVVSSDGSTQDVTATAAWTSSDDTVATVSSSGLVTAVAPGSVTFSANLNSLTGSAHVAVTSATLTSIQVTGPSVALALGTSEQLTATGLFSDGTTQDLTTQVSWSSSDDTVATVDDTTTKGLVSAIGAGGVSVTATDSTSGKQGSLSLAVTAGTLQSIAVSPASPSIAAGTTQRFVATGTFSDGSTQDLSSQVSWASDDQNVATIDASGLATGLSTGSANITATSGSISGSAILNVSFAALVRIDLVPASLTLAKGTSGQFAATGTFSDGTTQDLTAQVGWTSSDSTIAAVSSAPGSEGQVQAIAAGSATATATDSASGLSASANITVTLATLVSIDVEPSFGSIPSGATEQLSATGTYSDGSTLDLTSAVTWTSSDTNVASVSNASGTRGLATGAAQGSVTIFAADPATGISGSAGLDVTAPVLVSIVIAPGSASIAKGTTANFVATGKYSDGSFQDLTGSASWSSSDDNIATVSQGTATGLAQGTVTLTATDASGIFGTATLAVGPAALAEVDVTPTSSSIAAGTTEQLVATGVYTDGTTADLTSLVTWTSSDDNVATPSNFAGSHGVVNGAGQGGPVTLTATDPSGLAGTAQVTVTAATLTTIVVNPGNASIAKGTGAPFTAMGNFSDGTIQDLTATVIWTSSNNAIASFPGAPGQAFGNGVGTVTLTATQGSVSGTAQLSVTAALLQSITVAPGAASIAKGTKQQFVATGHYSDGSTQDISSQLTWSSSNAGIASVSSAPGSKGLATGVVSGGPVTITATDAATGVSGSANLTVTAATLATIAISPVSGSIVVNQFQQYAATGTYSDGSSQNITGTVTWSSSNAGVASISNAGGTNGKAQGLSAGSTTITATSSGVTSNSASLNVAAKTLVSIAVTPNPLSATPGNSAQATATGTYNDGSTANITNSVSWVSSDTSKFTVSSTGLVTGVSNGTATIYAISGGISGSAQVNGQFCANFNYGVGNTGGFGNPTPFTCPSGATKWCDVNPISPTSAAQAQIACQTCFGQACVVRSGDCAGDGYGLSNDSHIFGFVGGGCSSEPAGRIWQYGSSYSFYGTWAP